MHTTFILLGFGTIYNFTNLLKIKRNYRNPGLTYFFFFLRVIQLLGFFLSFFLPPKFEVMHSKFSFYIGFTKIIFSYVLFSLGSVLLFTTQHTHSHPPNRNWFGQNTIILRLHLIYMKCKSHFLSPPSFL